MKVYFKALCRINILATYNAAVNQASLCEKNEK